MASSSVRAVLECSVCLTTFTDPVNLTCGHTYCRLCINRVLDTQGGSGGYSCPDCRQKFRERPALHINIALRKILSNVLSADQEEKRILCTYCVDSNVPAVKSCLMCKASLCGKHLKVHSKAPGHVLCDPTTSLGGQKCPVHKKILEYYCTEDSTYICVMCRTDGAHKRHRVKMLDEESGNRKKKQRIAENMMPAFPPFAVSSSFPLEEQRGTFDDYTEDESEQESSSEESEGGETFTEQESEEEEALTKSEKDDIEEEESEDADEEENEYAEEENEYAEEEENEYAEEEENEYAEEEENEYAEEENEYAEEENEYAEEEENEYAEEEENEYVEEEENEYAEEENEYAEEENEYAEEEESEDAEGEESEEEESENESSSSGES